jgi:hypothetical protein
MLVAKRPVRKIYEKQNLTLQLLIKLNVGSFNMYCPFCHKPLFSLGESKHVCKIIGNHDDELVLGLESVKDKDKIRFSIRGIDRFTDWNESKSVKDNLLSFCRYLILEIHKIYNLDLETLYKKYPIENILNCWALLELIPDNGIPCRNIRSLDLVADPESLFSSCKFAQEVAEEHKIKRREEYKKWKRSPAGKEWYKKYWRRPDVKEKARKYYQEYNRKNKN